MTKVTFVTNILRSFSQDTGDGASDKDRGDTEQLLDKIEVKETAGNRPGTQIY